MIFNISNFEIGSGRVFVIAEIGNNHNGSFQRAKEMIDKRKQPEPIVSSFRCDI